MDTGVEQQGINIRRKRIEEIAPQAGPLLFVESEAPAQVVQRGLLKLLTQFMLGNLPIDKGVLS